MINLNVIENNPRYIGAYLDIDTINAISNPEVGMICYCEDEDKMYRYNKAWEVVLGADAGGQDISMSLYEMNRSIITQLGPMSQEIISEKIEMINEFQKLSNNDFYMLFGKEVSYFTVFNVVHGIDTNDTLGTEVFSCFESVGRIYDIDIDSNGAIAIWAQSERDHGTISCFYLFPYDMGIVQIGQPA